jgi:hypothetical protein
MLPLHFTPFPSFCNLVLLFFLLLLLPFSFYILISFFLFCSSLLSLLLFFSSFLYLPNFSSFFLSQLFYIFRLFFLFLTPSLFIRSFSLFLPYITFPLFCSFPLVSLVFLSSNPHNLINLLIVFPLPFSLKYFFLLLHSCFSTTYYTHVSSHCVSVHSVLNADSKADKLIRISTFILILI